MITLKERFDKLYEQIVMVKLHGEDFSYLIKPSENYHEALQSSYFIERMQYNARATFCLKLCSLLDKDEHYNLTSFIRMILTERRNSTYETKVSK